MLVIVIKLLGVTGLRIFMAADKTEPVVAQHLKSAEQMPMAKTGTTSGK